MKSSKVIALCAVFLALMIVLGALPIVFFLPVLLVCTLFKFRAAVLAGLAYGLVSLAYAFMGGTAVAVAFVMYPWIAILPRVLAACCASGIHKLTAKLFANGTGRLRILVPAGAAAVTGSLMNTVLVLGSIYLFYGGTDAGRAVLVQTSLIMIYALGEVVAQMILLPPLTLILSRQLSKTGGRAKV